MQQSENMATLSNADQSSKWTSFTGLQSKQIRHNAVCIGKSIWISTDYNSGDRGMIHYDCDSNTIKEIVKYPNLNGFQPEYHSVCGSNEQGVTIVDGEKGKLITFNPKTNKFGPVVAIPRLGRHASSVMIKGNIHIMHGNRNSKNQYLIYSMKTRKVTEFKDDLKTPAMKNVSITKTNEGQYVKFCGTEWKGVMSGIGGILSGSNGKAQWDSIDAFYVGSLDNGNAERPIKWKKVPHWTLPKALHKCGVVQRGPVIAVFGGCGGYTGSKKYLDEIYILDTRTQKGWTQSSIKCPVKSQYVATLDPQQRAHIFTKSNDIKRHFSIALKDLIPELTTSSMLRNVHLVQRDEDEKDGDVEYENVKLRAINSNLIEENKRLKNQNTLLVEQQKMNQRKIAALESKVNELELRVLNASEFTNWNGNQVLLWMMSLEQGRFEKYEPLLKAALLENEVNGKDLSDITVLTLKSWGTRDRKDAKGLNDYIQELIQLEAPHGAAMMAVAAAAAIPQENEGAPTAFVG